MAKAMDLCVGGPFDCQYAYPPPSSAPLAPDGVYVSRGDAWCWYSAIVPPATRAVLAEQFTKRELLVMRDAVYLLVDADQSDLTGKIERMLCDE